MVNTSWVPVLVLVLFGAVQAKQQNCDDHDQCACQHQQRSWCNCSEPAADCKMVEQGKLFKELTCKYRVTKQDLIVNRPKIEEVKVEKYCHFWEKGDIHTTICNMCSEGHNPCNNTFRACLGCCPRKTYVDEQGKAIKDTQGKVMTVFMDNIQVRKGKFQCEDIKKYFMRENNCDLNLEPVTKEEEAAVEMQDDVGIEIAIQLKDHDDKVDGLILEKVLRDQCAPGVMSLECKRLPAVVNFDCNPCNIGSPMLLKKCCNHCVKFSKSETLKDLKADDGTGFVPFVNCGGCQTDHINMSGGGSMPWIYAGKYAQYEKEVAQARMSRWIETNICPLMDQREETCDSRRLAGKHSNVDQCVEDETASSLGNSLSGSPDKVASNFTDNSKDVNNSSQGDVSTSPKGNNSSRPAPAPAPAEDDSQANTAGRPSATSTIILVAATAVYLTRMSSL